MKTIRRGVGVGVVTTLIVGILGSATASAQIYPEPDGYCTISLSDPLPKTNTEIRLTVTAADSAGNPLPDVTGDLFIAEQPGDDAQLRPSAFTTGADGTDDVTLYTGSTNGLIRVGGPCDDVELTATVPVGSPPGPPQTGAGPDEGSSTAAMAGAFGVLALLGTGVGVGVLRRRNVRI